MIIIKNQKSKKSLKISLIIIAIVMIIATIGGLMLKYHVEGESNLPFILKKITIISTVDGKKNEDKENKWNIDIMQVNDIYLEIEKNEELKKQEIIKTVKIDNIQITKSPSVGITQIIKIQKDENGINVYKEEEGTTNFYYQGSKNTDLEDFKIANQGGMIGFRYLISNIKNYISNEETIKYNGELLDNININFEQIKSNICFDVIIELESGIKYKTNIELELPNNNLMEEETSIRELTDKIIFKRI